MKKNVIEVKNLEKYYEISRGLFGKNKGVVKAVDDISFEIPQGESLGLVGQVAVVKLLQRDHFVY